MFLSLLSFAIPALTSAFITYFSFKPYYAQSEYALFLLLAVSALITLVACIPFARTSRLLLALSGTLIVINLTFNLFFEALVLLLAFILPGVIPHPKGRSRLIFTHDNKLIRLNYAPLSRIRVHFARAGLIAFSVGGILFALTFSFTSPNFIWNMRAFPIDLTDKPFFEADAVPSGMVTCMLLHDNTAIYIDSFSDIATENGIVPSPAKSAGMQKGDVISKINGQKAKKSDFIKNGADGSTATFTVLRPGSGVLFDEVELEVTPVYSIPDGKYMIGIYYYDHVLESLYRTIQTISFSYPDTGYFAATAHASSVDIPDDYTCVLTCVDNLGRDDDGLTVDMGEAVGEIKHSNRFGDFGVWNGCDGEAIPIAKKSELRLGRATLLSGFAGGEIEEYSILITGTYRIDQRDVFCLVVTDKRLLDAGGITRGMSGSPVIQNGKIIGALSNMGSDGKCAYATFARDMAHELYLARDILQQEKEAAE